MRCAFRSRMKVSVSGSSIPVDSRRVVDELVTELHARAAVSKNAQDVRVVETATHWLLFGDRVYKIWKPVRLPFSDMRSIERRRVALNEELGEGRHAAPRTYLGVVPIRMTESGQATFGDDGAVIEHALVMARLDPARRADNLLRAGELGFEEIERLAAWLTSRHADAEIADGAQVSPTALITRIESDLAAVGGLLEALVSADGLRAVHDELVTFVRAHRIAFVRRAAAGLVRRAHGDLRLDHVFVTDDDDFEVLSSYAFDARSRYADSAADVAALTMDLGRLGRSDLAEHLIARVAEAEDDFGLYDVIDFYERARALSRAAMFALLASSNDAFTSTRAQENALYRASEAAAMCAVPRLRRTAPAVIVIAGNGVGMRSTVTERLARRHGASVLNLEPPLAPESGPRLIANGARETATLYAGMLDRTEHVLAARRSVVLSARFRANGLREAVRSLAATHGAKFALIECEAPARGCRARLKALPERCTPCDVGACIACIEEKLA